MRRKRKKEKQKMKERREKRLESKRKHKQGMKAFKLGHRDRRGQNRHHIVNQCRGGNETLQNLLRIDIEKHKSWHDIFDNLNIDEVIALLKRVKKAKANQKE